MTESEVQKILQKLVRPVGAMSDDKQRAALEQQLLEGDRVAAGERLLAAVASWRDAATLEAVEGEVSDLLADLAEDHRVPPMLVLAVQHPRTREAALDALALNPKPAVREQLAAFAGDCFTDAWTERAQVKFVSALASYGSAASPVLSGLENSSAMTPKVLAELRIARQGATMRDE